jgi:hypothetical protein
LKSEEEKRERKEKERRKKGERKEKGSRKRKDSQNVTNHKHLHTTSSQGSLCKKKNAS